MKTNRREFIATTAGALATLRSTQAAAQTITAPSTRKLRITFEGLAVISVSKLLKAPKGLPGTSPRVDVLFLDHPEHTAPRLLDLNNLTVDGLSLAGSYLRIKVGETVLDVGNTVLDPKKPGAVELDLSRESCAAGNWNSLRNLPEFESILEGRVDVLPSAFGTKPEGVAGRITLRTGLLSGEVPVGKYPDFEWKFKDGPPGYRKPFTDHVTWTTEIPAVGDVTVEAIPFAGGTPQSFTIQQKGDVALVAGSGRTTTPADPLVADHFEHYYHLLAYAGTLKPIPVQGIKACGKGKFTFTTFQEQRLKLLQDAIYRFRDLKRDDDCGGTEMFRGEPGICINGIAFSTAP